MHMTEGKDSIEFLKASPVFAMSLSAKELFHSNVLEWICKNVEGAWEVLFGPEMTKPLPRGAPKIDREKSNLDLTFSFGDGRLVVIENKVKSLPDKEQLDRYKSLVDNRRGSQAKADLILLAMGPAEADINPDWVAVDYGELSRRLKAVAELCLGYRRDLIVDYSGVVNALDSIARVAPNSWLEVPDGVQALRIQDLFEKRKADRLRLLLRDELRLRNIEVRADDGIGKRNEGNCVYIHHGLTRTQGLVGAVCLIGHVELGKPAGETSVVAGVQLQGGQLRSYVEFQLPDKSNPPLSESLMAAARALFDSAPSDRWWKDGEGSLPRRSGNLLVNQYDGRFFYRYVTVASLSDSSKSLSALASRIAEMLEGVRADRRRILDRLASTLGVASRPA